MFVGSQTRGLFAVYIAWMDLDTCSNTYSTIVHAHQCVAGGGDTRSIYFYSPLSNKEKINYLSRITKIHSRVVRGKPIASITHTSSSSS